jgi:hypothetical protein
MLTNQNLQVPPSATFNHPPSNPPPSHISSPFTPLALSKPAATPQIATGKVSNSLGAAVTVFRPTPVQELGMEGQGSPPSHPKKIAPLVSKRNFLYYEPVVREKEKGASGLFPIHLP